MQPGGGFGTSDPFSTPLNFYTSDKRQANPFATSSPAPWAATGPAANPFSGPSPADSPAPLTPGAKAAANPFAAGLAAFDTFSAGTTDYRSLQPEAAGVGGQQHGRSDPAAGGALAGCLALPDDAASSSSAQPNGGGGDDEEDELVVHSAPPPVPSLGVFMPTAGKGPGSAQATASSAAARHNSSDAAADDDEESERLIGNGTSAPPGVGKAAGQGTLSAAAAAGGGGVASSMVALLTSDKLRADMSRKVLASSVIGCTLEWFDFLLFVYLGAVISRLFFPGACVRA